VQIGAIDGRGNVLMDNVLVKPTVPIEPEAVRVHHISEAMVANAPSFADVLPRLRDAVRNRLLVIYNADYDLRLLVQSAKAHGVTPDLPHAGYDCAMLRYAEWVGKWNDYHGSFRWQKLDGGDHSALGDCRATLAVIEKMAGG
jgi:DNA polymerase-3 subunit epsilon